MALGLNISEIKISLKFVSFFTNIKYLVTEFSIKQLAFDQIRKARKAQRLNRKLLVTASSLEKHKTAYNEEAFVHNCIITRCTTRRITYVRMHFQRVGVYETRKIEKAPKKRGKN